MKKPDAESIVPQMVVKHGADSLEMNNFQIRSFTSFSYTEHKIFIMGYAHSDLTHTLFSYDLNTGVSTQKQLPGPVDFAIADLHPQIDFINETTGFLGLLGIWKTLDHRKRLDQRISLQ